MHRREAFANDFARLSDKAFANEAARCTYLRWRFVSAAEEVTVVPGSASQRHALQGLLDRPQLAERLATSERHVRRLVAERRIPFVRVGRLVRFDPVDIARWLEEHTER